MIQIEVFPLKGIRIQDVGEIHLGQSESEVVKLLGQPKKQGNEHKLFYHNYELRIDLDKLLNVEFIEFISGPFPEKIKLSLYSVDPFQFYADNLKALLAEKNNGQIDESEADYGYYYINISVGIWRPFTEKSVEESISEMKSDGTYELNKDVQEFDLEKSKHFWTLGIGIANYYGLSD